ncbi:transmembrane protein 144-like isoform X1 [Ostrea edulis]|uniref:transmembrane protein 144-like isoform X1 n=1 Tax=Ostrea edulis TaxID=37623 RepID=UPI0024AEFC05|nr:transmembrane protein 144-like isoform X1 [Ostrea edulis]XP_056010434.1 transmembrane protein 144-like isoform X1 [Ostrea edulis]XP_056010435.1 transmembrane protein 144-like isoform X1 [Ostrea edulis]XP_056010436.1 transmembrane protein 144-like isoform X1 [Ostrea edulis]XP_056010437.1 transmembrane protein 144-like isoform X1 [Ostrea edulis]XP_056010438.1 transmembrane protein 144-like isoform X1 [Ostrea edulis]XP_056010439.1 transmembrane protein 144-like isoform X1 [Ostrea edulis]XP_0
MSIQPVSVSVSVLFICFVTLLLKSAETSKPTSFNTHAVSTLIENSSYVTTTANYTTDVSTFTTAEVTVSDATLMTTEFPFTNATGGTTVPGTTAANTGDNGTIPEYMGYITAGIAVLLYGSNFAPIKKFESGDGMFFQWILCGAALLVGIIVQVIRGTRHFYPVVMIGGLVWETGNICVVPIVKTIGMGLGLCIWGMTNLLSGWATSRFGLFGVTPSTSIGNDILNTIGVVIAVSSSVIFAFVKNEVTPIQISSETSPLLDDSPSRQSYGSPGDSLYNNSNNHDQLVFNQGRSRGSINRDPAESSDSSFIDQLSPGKKRILGIILSVFSGVLYGQMFTPAIYLQGKKGNSTNGLDYVFACFCGIYLTSTAYFIVYIIFMKNKPKIYPKIILPGIASGLMWGIATAAWFVANQALSPAISFPIISTGPSIVASLWGIFVFREIRGTKNILILLLGFAFVITGAVLTALSEKR